MAVITDPNDPNYVEPDPTPTQAAVPDPDPTAEQGVVNASTTGSATTDQTVAEEIGATPTPGLGEYMTPEATVRGQMEGLLDSDSKYITGARARADEAAQQMGLLSSSMAAGASERAAIESGLPIAQADAKTYATGALAQQGQVDNLAALEYQADRQLQHEAFSQESANYRAEMETQASMDVAGWELNSNERISYMDAIGSLGERFLADMSGLLNSDRLTPEAKDIAMANLKLNYEEALTFTKNAIGLDLGFGTGGTGGTTRTSGTGDTGGSGGSVNTSGGSSSNTTDPGAIAPTPDADGNLTFSNGTVINGDGSIVLSSGTTINTDGTVTTSAGAFIDPATGTITAGNGSVIPPTSTDTIGNQTYADGTIVQTDGTIIDTDGTKYRTDGTVLYTDGTVMNPDGTVKLSDGSIVNVDGTWLSDASNLNPNSSLPSVSVTVLAKDFTDPVNTDLITKSQGLFYENIATGNYDSFAKFDADMTNAGVMDSPEFLDFKTQYGSSIITGFGPVIPTQQPTYDDITGEVGTTTVYAPGPPIYGAGDAQILDTYNALMYGTLNANNPEAQAEAISLLSIAGPATKTSGWNAQTKPGEPVLSLSVTQPADTHMSLDQQTSDPLYAYWLYNGGAGQTAAIA